ncbi:MAG TPA: aldo/keto reductase [Candidatus Saccharimonadales bacterium]|nr:aldo/keto reductase [Candidatus Saccharimonadales bacterium]
MNLNSKVTLHTGNKMPILGLGTWQLSDDTAGTIAKALLLGYPMIDTSGDYGTQPGIAEGIKKSRAKREDFYLITKVEETDDAYEATKRNLQELQLDYADLMLIHRPPKGGAGLKLWEGLKRAKREGLAKDIGVSNYSAKLIEELVESSGEVPVVNQIEWSPFGHSFDMLDYCTENDIIVQAYSPLTRSERLNDPELTEIASKYEKSPAQILTRWNLQIGTVPIIKANKVEHLKEDLNVFDFEITDEDMETLNSLNEEYSALGDLQYV